MRAITLAIAVLTATALTACSATAPDPAPLNTPLTHVHGLAFDVDQDALVVATHEGVFRVDIGGTDTVVEGPVGGFDFDAMGFTIIAGTAYASGHPGQTTPDTFGRPNLGLIRSDDLGVSWTNVSLVGETDFHDLTISESRPTRIYGIDGTTLRRSDDGGETWVALGSLEARDILTPPNDSEVVYATTAQGLLMSSDSGAGFTKTTGAPPLLLVVPGAYDDGRLTGIDVAGSVWAQDADGQWIEGGKVSGSAQAMLVLPASGRLIVADDRGIVMSDDAGETWESLWLS